MIFKIILFLFLISSLSFAAEAPPTLKELELEKALVESQMQVNQLSYQQLNIRRLEIIAEIEKRFPAEKVKK